MSYFRYIAESKRFRGGWCRGAVWAVLSDDFREFLTYINECGKHTGVETRVRRIPGDPDAKYIWPEDRRVV